MFFNIDLKPLVTSGSVQVSVGLMRLTEMQRKIRNCVYVDSMSTTQTGVINGNISLKLRKSNTIEPCEVWYREAWSNDMRGVAWRLSRQLCLTWLQLNEQNLATRPWLQNMYRFVMSLITGGEKINWPSNSTPLVVVRHDNYLLNCITRSREDRTLYRTSVKTSREFT